MDDCLKYLVRRNRPLEYGDMTPIYMNHYHALNVLLALKENDDPERAHALADDVLLEFLRGLGYDDIVDAWEAITPKWYA